jgi:hypothetical protein
MTRVTEIIYSSRCRFAQSLMVGDFAEVGQVRQTKAEVLIQDLLSGPVVGYSYDDAGPAEEEGEGEGERGGEAAPGTAADYCGGGGGGGGAPAPAERPVAAQGAGASAQPSKSRKNVKFSKMSLDERSPPGAADAGSGGSGGGAGVAASRGEAPAGDAGPTRKAMGNYSAAAKVSLLLCCIVLLLVNGMLLFPG